MKIFHVLPYNPIPSGGVKVHFQLSELEQELGYESYVVYADGQQHYISWFDHHVSEITWQEMLDMADKRRDIIVGWENTEALVRSGFFNKVMYVQGEVFIDRSNPYYGIDIWISSAFNHVSLSQFHAREVFIVNPFVDSWRFAPEPDDSLEAWKARPTEILIQERKDGQGARARLMLATKGSMLDRSGTPLDIQVLSDCSETEFASALRSAKIFLTHSFPEGFGLPPLEAMASGCIVVGFTGGGGTDFMVHGENSLIAPTDGDFMTFAAMLGFARSMDDTGVQTMRRSALQTAHRYSRHRTREQLRVALEKYEVHE